MAVMQWPSALEVLLQPDGFVVAVAAGIELTVVTIDFCLQSAVGGVFHC